MITATEGRQLTDLIDRGHALPSNWYTDQSLFKGENDRILRRSWHYVTHTGSLAEVGEQFLWDIGGVPIVLVRDRERKIRGFVNICRHRAHPVVIEAGRRKTLQCLYHGWSYDLDGAVRRVPRSEFEPSFDTTDLGLVPVQTHVWGDMVWVNLDLEAAPFTEWIDGLPDLMRTRGCAVDDFVHAYENTWEIEANWKVFQDNTIECYHCPTTHPEFCRAVDPNPETQQLGIGGRYWIHHKLPFQKDFGTKLLQRPGATEEPWYYYYNWIFPTTYLQHYGRGYDIGSIQVVGVDRLVFRHVVFLSPETDAETLALGKKHLDADPTIPQDVDICRRVQQAHDAGVAPVGTLLPDSEFLLQHFSKLVVELMTEP